MFRLSDPPAAQDGRGSSRGEGSPRLCPEATHAGRGVQAHGEVNALPH